ncbi:COX15/CtaA family protein [Fibrivirga algicola]|uniref:Heme A synthase n=1 Tax=Fibrivirga algicola TaxID=2950420 RepID=A0ABX0QDC0_9BACT|nr:COX15/CtaA family protein [Fibrivirga algicola]ARK09527.1 cytochrome oxidase assembly protein [Fibrella sp. ES10-3-2-2]NID10404.1 heme A synthase [Fibrivirga algicola]
MISSSSPINEHSFRRLALLTVIAVFLLILVGGVVRSTGAGMGCPDWPKCFGQWVPPTDVSQLPANYQEIYSHRGYANTEFNAVKTWIEYLNRLLGALIGVFIFITFVASAIAYWQRDRAIVGYSFLALLLVGFQGWLGAKVVSSVLAAWLITLHMLLAIIIVGVLLYVVARTQIQSLSVSAQTFQLSKASNRWLLISSGLLLIQILLGTQVRETVDEVANKLGELQRFRWVEELDIRFYVHRSFSLIVLICQLLWIVPVSKQLKKGNPIRRMAIATGSLLVVEILTGAIMAYFAIPAWAQPVHLTLAVVSLGIQFVVILFSFRNVLMKSTTDLSLTHVDESGSVTTL